MPSFTGQTPINLFYLVKDVAVVCADWTFTLQSTTCSMERKCVQMFHFIFHQHPLKSDPGSDDFPDFPGNSSFHPKDSFHVSGYLILTDVEICNTF